MDLPQIPAAAAFALTLVLTGGCGGSDVASPISTTLAGQPSETPVTTSDLPDPSVSATVTTSSGEVDAAEQPVNVYWMWSIADASSGSPERLAASSRPFVSSMPVS